MAGPRNILFIMRDQLRWDYLSCAGHKTLQTPNIDALAARGVRFSNAYCQSPICGPSRMSFYTGRYMSTHGSTLITSKLPFEEWTETLGTERLSGALLDRLTHHVNILEMNGESYRLNQNRARLANPST